MTPEFRAWDKLTQKYWNIENWHFEDEYLDLIESGVSIADPNIERVWRKFNEVELMQYTGLKDKNGHKIFEGDIVRVYYVGYFDGENPHNQFVTSVEFNAPMFDLNRHHIPQAWALYSSLSALFDLFEDDDYEIEVIGNIHENLELLEEDK